MLKTRIVVADDEALMREGIVALLRYEPDMEVVGFASSASEAVERCSECEPDVILMEIGMAGVSSFEASRQIRRARPGTKVLFVTSRDDEDFLIQAMDAGAAGYVLKTGPASQLMIAIRDVCRGGSYLSPPMLNKLVADFRSRANGTRPTTRLETLTNREREVLKMLAEGNSVKEIAAIFDLSVKTVEAHKFNLMRKLDLHNKAQLVQYAIQKRVISIAS
jgi:DNA-binding NarL/FixJ family response regulator